MEEAPPVGVGLLTRGKTCYIDLLYKNLEKYSMGIENNRPFFSDGRMVKPSIKTDRRLSTASLKELRAPMQILMANGSKEEFPMNTDFAKSRVKLLEEVLFGGTDDEKYDAKKESVISILSEIFVRDAIGLFPKIDPSQDTVRLSPSFFDGSQWLENLQIMDRGGDILIGKKANGYVDPVVLIDVTITTSNSHRARKAKHPSGFNQELGVPVVVLPLGGFTFVVARKPYDVREYLFNLVAPVMLKNEYRPLFGMQKENKTKFLEYLRSRINFGYEKLMQKIKDGEYNQLTVKQRKSLSEKIDLGIDLLCKW